ncbi:glycosyltransferase family 4 protein [Haloarculaceae archaeon H-GB2-1]|nr:glycosyltransferase family 4 protein [Haloarculaceae archaeon H-GB1-1]MEA5406542.1 glycosyltransferase family 4 protein [Haloarculaceae archaeon H-GB2-1]
MTGTMLYYLSNANLPGKKAHTIQQMKMCQAFASCGEEVCFVHPSHGTSETIQWETLADYYGLETRFRIETLPSLQSRPDVPDKVGLLTMTGTLTGWLLKESSTGRLGEDDILYSRNYYPTFAFSELRSILPQNRRPTTVLEHHDIISAYGKERFFRSVDGVVCITEALKEYDLATYDVTDPFVAPDGVDLTPYAGLSKKFARRQLDIPADETVVAYTGHLYPGKGGQVLAAAADRIDATVYVVGGYPADVERVKTTVEPADNVVLTGFVDPSDIPLYQVAADILVAPYTRSARDYISPLKLFEYMAAGRPIVASDLSVLKEVLTDGENALLAEPGDSDALAEAVTRVLSDTDLAQQLSATVSEQVRQYTWRRRAERILSYVQDLR